MAEATTGTIPQLRHAVAPIRGLEVRAGEQTGDGSITMRGHAAVFDEETTLFDFGWWRLREKIEPGAFGPVLGRSPLVHLVHQHDMATAMAATDVEGIGGLELSEDDEGLLFFARVDPADADVARLRTKMERGYVRQASFAFTIAPGGYRTESTFDDENNEDELLTITEIGELYDVSIVAQGAYPTTDAELAARMRALGRLPLAGATTRVAPDDPAGAEHPVAPEPPAGEDTTRRRRVAALRAHARTRLAIATLDIRR